jgi:hypothetical protein
VVSCELTQSGAVFDGDERRDGRHALVGLVDDRQELTLRHDAAQVRVVDHVAHLGRHEAVVDVDADGADLHQRQQRLHVLVPVEEEEPHVVASLDRRATRRSAPAGWRACPAPRR